MFGKICIIATLFFYNVLSNTTLQINNSIIFSNQCTLSEKPETIIPSDFNIVHTNKNENNVLDEKITGRIPSMEEWREQILNIVSALASEEPHNNNNEKDNNTSNENIMADQEPKIEQMERVVDNKMPQIDQKLRFNYASADCGSKVLSSNSEATEVGSILFEAKDRYMLNPCTANLWITIELCEDIGIDTIAIANYEFFSSMFKDFSIYGSNKYPTNDWDFIQSFTAQNIRELQYFYLQEPEHFKYIKLEITSHYGTEFYCPISVIKIHGSTLVEELKKQLQKDSEELDRFTNAMKSTTVSNPIISSSSSSSQNNNNIDLLHNALPPNEDDIDILNIIYTNIATTPSPSCSNPYIDLQEDVILIASDIVDDLEKFVTSTPTPSTIPHDNSNILSENSHPTPNSDSIPNTININSNNNNNNNVEQVTTAKTGRHQQEENIFKTLANRIKSLEMNQSITSKYLEEMNARYLSFLTELKTSIAKLEVEHIKFSKIIYGVENQRISSQSKIESQLEQFDRRLASMESSVAMELFKLREQFQNRESEQRNELIGIVILTIIAVFIVLYMERFRFQQNYSQLDLQHSVLKKENTTDSESKRDILSMPTKKSKKHHLKKAKSFANFNKHPVEAPL